MKIMTLNVRFIAALGAILFSNVLYAHSDLEKPLFVSADGIDAGRCLDAENPCRTISYALAFAGKGGQIRVADGSYAVENTEDLFHLVSGVVDIQGGFRKDESFTQISGSSVLTGVPVEYRSTLQAKGFNVVADRKGIDGPEAAQTEKVLALHQQLKVSSKAVPCVNGSSGGLDCNFVDLLSHVALADFSGGPTQAADVWGFVDLNTNREYAIVGLDTGTAVLDVTDPENPLEVGVAVGLMAVWRDIKVYQFFDAAADRWKAYAYVTTDGAADGMIVIDLTGLPHQISRTSYSSDFSSAHNVYATATDFTTGLSQTGNAPSLVIAGSNLGCGEYRSYSLANPTTPTFVAQATTNNCVAEGNPIYMHDAASMIITDPRMNSQCVNATTYCEILFDFNETTVDIWDVTDIADPQRLSRTPYINSGYVHSGWWSEDKQYMFVHDELDEQRSGLQTTLRVFDLTDLTAPTLAATWTGATGAIDHNGFVRGSRYYMSNYSQGLTVLDISDPLQPVEVGNIDTYPFSDGTNFVGAWGAYPYFPSGNIAISDIDSGFYLASDQTRIVPEGSLSFTSATYSAVEGQSASLTVQRTDGSSGNVSVDFEILAATADGDDYTVATGMLDWTVGDTGDRFITLPITDDQIAEGLEQVIVRLLSPGGGATLGTINMATLYMSDQNAQSELRFLDTIITVGETGIATAILAVQRVGSAEGQVTVDYAITGGDASTGSDYSGDTAGSLSWADGDADPKTLVISIIDDIDGEATEFFQLGLSNPQGASIPTNATVHVNITSNEGPEPPIPPPPAPRGGGGGGAPAPLLLFVLATLIGSRSIRKGVA